MSNTVLIPSSSGLKAGPMLHGIKQKLAGLNPFFIRSQGRTDPNKPFSVF